MPNLMQAMLLLMQPSGGGDPMLTGLTAAWPMFESGDVLRRNHHPTFYDPDNNHLPSFGVGSANGHANFVAAESDYMLLSGATDLNLASTDEPFTIMITVKPDTVAGLAWIINKNDGDNNNNAEFSLYRNGANFYFRIGSGSNFNTVSDSGFTAVAGTEYKIIFGHDPVNDVISIKIDDRTMITIAHSIPTIANGDGNLYIGRRSDGFYYDGEISDLYYWNGRYFSEDEQVALAAWSPLYTRAYFDSLIIDPDDLPSINRYRRLDWSDTAALWQDAAKTTAVSSDTDPIRVIEDSWNSHDWTAPSDAARPTWQEAELNGLGVGEWNGSNSQMDFDEVWPISGDFTAWIVVKNLDATYGSHILAPDHYVVITGSSYSGSERVVLHFDQPSVTAISALLVNTSDDWNIIELRLESGTYTIGVNGGDEQSFADPNGIAFSRAGQQGDNGADWWDNSQKAELVHITNVPSAQDRAYVRAFLADKWGIENVW